MLYSVAYLGFQKGGPNVRWPLVLTQGGGGGQTKFSNFLLCQKKIFGQRRGAWPNAPPPKYATGYIRLALLFHYYIISIRWLVTSQNVNITKVSQKSLTLTLTLILNTNYECHKAYIRLLQLFDIKLMGKNTKMTCSSLLHKELWYIFEKINDLQNQGHVTPKSNLPSWKHGKTYSTMLPLSNDTKCVLVTCNANDFTSGTWLTDCGQLKNTIYVTAFI